MIQAIIKFMVGTLLGVAVALLLLFNVLLLWVATGPRSLDKVSKYIEAAFQPADHSYSIKIEEAWLIWDGWKHPVDIRLRNVDVLNQDKVRFCRFPEITLGLDLWSLVEVRLLPTSLTISHPDLLLFQHDDRSISFGFHKDVPPAPGAEEEITEVPLAAIMAPLVSPDERSNLRELHTVSIVNADVSVGNVHKGVFFKATDAQMVFKSNRRGMNVFGSATINYDKYQSLISAQLAMRGGSATIDGDVKFSQLMPGALATLFAGNTLLSSMKFPVSGEGKISIDTEGTLQRIDFSMDGGKGTIETPKLDGALPVASLHAEGNISNQYNDIVISKFTADLGGMAVDADGVISRKADDAAIAANLLLKNIPAADVHRLWPLGLAPETREWVTHNITEGKITESESHINIALGDLAKPELPKADVDTTVTIEGNTIRYLPEHPPLTNVNGQIHIDGVSLNAQIESAQFLKQTKLSGGTVAIDDLNVDNPYIKVAFDADMPAKDAVHFLDLPRLKHAKRLNLNPDTVEGSVTGHAAVGFSFFAEHDEHGKEKDSDITYDIKADVKGITQPGFMQKFDVKNAAGAMTVNNELIEFKGSGEVNGANVSQSDVKYLFGSKEPFDTLIEATATAPVTVLPRFGYPAFPFIKGNLAVKASLKEGANIEVSQASIDLTNASMDIDAPAVHWSKPDKEPATIEITSQKKNNVATIPSFQIKGKNMEVRGSAELSKDLSSISAVKADKVMCGATNLSSVVYEKSDSMMKVDAKGSSADMTAWLDASGDSTFSFEHFPALALNLDIKQLTLGKGRALGNVKGSLNCDAKQCGSADISGTTVDNKPFGVRILHNPKGNRQLSLRAQSAGAFLKATGLFDSMEGGDLTVTGSYDDSGAHSVLKAVADINEHTIKDAPVLAKMLSLASLTGFFDTLRGNGIAFTKLRAPFTLSNDVITIKEGKTHGDAMGMTMEGTITFPKRSLDLNGTIVPSYTLNNVLGNVPLVGHMLTGGEGQGVFAARYSIKGSDKAPDVSVNPLSILTPGFLRGLFDVFDSPSKKGGDSK